MTSDKGGRPPIGRRFTFRLDDDDRRQLEEMATSSGVPTADLVRRAIRQYLETRNQ
jgi:predicted transcriptional regulator